MGFQKGKPKTGGRKAGTPNKATSDVKSRIAGLIDEKFETINRDLDSLDPKDRITAYLKFLEYVVPKQREQRIDLSNLSDEEVENLIDKAVQQLQNIPR